MLDQQVGARVREARRAMNMSQTDIGEELCISFTLVENYERGTAEIPAATLYQLSRLLRRDVAWFFPPADCNRQGFAHKIAQATKRKPIEVVSLECAEMLLNLGCVETAVVMRDLISTIVEREIRQN